MLGDTGWGGWRSAFVGAVVAAVLLLSFPVVGAVGSSLVLGQANSADAVTFLSGAANANLRLTNTQAGASALDLRVVSGSAPLKVNSTALVVKLNADRLDGRHASAFLPAEGRAADSALLDGRQLEQVRAFVDGCSSADLPGGLWLCQMDVDVPTAGTLVFSGSADAQYTAFSGSSVLNCHFLIDGYVETSTYRHGVLTPSQQYGFCGSQGYRAGLSVGTHTVSFYVSSSDQANTPLGSGSAQVLFFPSS